MRYRNNLDGQNKASLPLARATNTAHDVQNSSGICEHAFGGDRAAADAHAANTRFNESHSSGEEARVGAAKELHHRKRELANSLLEGAEAAAKISEEELLGLLTE